MADDDDAQNAVRRILKERPPEDLPSGAAARLKKRLDAERPAKPATRTGIARKKKSKAVR
jgi:hypothetical protein